MRVVSPFGVGESRRLPGSGAGPSPDRLFLGSEGILGVITEAWMRLQDRPRWRAAASVHFADYERAVAASRAIAQAALYPANCRLLDPMEALINAGTSSAGGVLVLGFESADHPVSHSMERAVELCRDHGGDVPDPVRYTDGVDAVARRSAAATWRDSFLRMPYQRDALASRSMIVETFETACTWDRFPSAAPGRRGSRNRGARVGRGGGCSPAASATCIRTDRHRTSACTPRDGQARPSQQWDQIKAAVSDALDSNGATITHHHAVGRDHRAWYDQQRPDMFATALSAAKAALDPAGILNPGVLIGAQTT